jgi:RES domain-containing protein
MLVWRIGTDTPDYTADDVSGTGAKITGGRWNRPGRPVLYCANTPSLACLETLVHLGTSGLPFNRYLVSVDIPAAVWKARRTETPNSLPVGWDACPVGKVSLDFGDNWLASGSSAVLVVPSSIVIEDPVILVNPLHPQAKGITATNVRKWIYDPRLE